MLIIKLLFLILIIVCAVFYILYIGDFSLVLLAVISAVPLIMLIMLLISKKSISVKFAVKSKTAAKKEIFDIQLCVKNKCPFPIGKAEALIEYYNIFNNEINTLELHFPILPRNSQRVTFQLSSKFCGRLKIRSAYIFIYDPLRIFRFKIGRNISEGIVILPEGHEINAISSTASRLNDESSVLSEHSPGDDPSEVFDLREYLPGDKLNRIHWKLSSKNEDFIVKDYSLPIDSSSVIFLNLHCCENSEFTLPIYDTLLELLVSFSQLLLENERSHTIVYYSCTEKQFVKREINDTDTLAAALNELILSLNDDLSANAPNEYFSASREYLYTSFTFISAEKNEQLLSFIDEELDSDIKNAVITVKSPDEADKLSLAYPELNVVPVVIGRISSFVKGVEI